MGFGPSPATAQRPHQRVLKVDPDWPDWKKEQFFTKQRLKPVLIYMGLTLNLQIKEFKRHYKGQNKTIANYKKGVWDQIKERSQTK